MRQLDLDEWYIWSLIVHTGSVDILPELSLYADTGQKQQLRENNVFVYNAPTISFR